MKTTRTIIVGGFLGAGKTTLLFEATKMLMGKGLKVGLITNDQAPELVDTALLLQTHVQVAEVSGSCFCCNFNGFIDSLLQVKLDAHADIIIAEPVGSCTDLSATIMQPLKELMNAELIVAPLTVLADPARLSDILDGGTAGLHPSAAYIFSKQLEESDIILITKTDLMQPHEVEQLKEKVKVHYPQSEVLTVSSKTSVGLDEWLQKVLTSTVSGQHIVEVDYERYAEGEAVLGWLNSTISLHGKEVDWDSFAQKFLTELGEKVDRLGIGVGHIKIMLESGANYLVGNLTGNLSTLSIRGRVGFSNDAQLIINARVGISPDLLEKMVKETLDYTAGNSIAQSVKAWKCFSPSYPNPTYRYRQVI